MSLESVIRQVEAAFADAPRPSNDELLHPDCRDDGDIQALYEIPHWRDVPDEVVVREYAAFSFLSPAGFRHFLPAYLSFALRNPTSPAYTIESTIYALSPLAGPGLASPVNEDPRLREFALSKYALLDADQRAAIVAFLEAMADTQDEYLVAAVEKALEHWKHPSP